MQTRVIGCIFSADDLHFVRIELESIFIAFDSGKIIIYTREITSEDCVHFMKDRNILKCALGPLFKNFGIHNLKGGSFEITISDNSKDDFICTSGVVAEET